MKPKRNKKTKKETRAEYFLSSWSMTHIQKPLKKDQNICQHKITKFHMAKITICKVKTLRKTFATHLPPAQTHLPLLAAPPFLTFSGNCNCIYPVAQDPHLGVLFGSPLSIIAHGQWIHCCFYPSVYPKCECFSPPPASPPILKYFLFIHGTERERA